MKTPILFLDIDGVLNNEEWYTEERVARINALVMAKEQVPLSEHLNPEKCKLLEQVIQETHCFLVLSSTWRHYHPLATVRFELSCRGVMSAHFIGDTGPALTNRDEEILSWLNTHEHAAWVALDDNSLPQIKLMGRFVQTRYACGLCAEDIPKLVDILTTPRTTHQWNG